MSFKSCFRELHECTALFKFIPGVFTEDFAVEVADIKASDM